MNTPYGLEISENCVSCKLRTNHKFCALSSGVLEPFSTASHLSTYPGVAVLFVEGQRPRGAFVLCSGRVKLSTTARDGRVLLVKIAEAGEVLSLSAVISGTCYEVTQSRGANQLRVTNVAEKCSGPIRIVPNRKLLGGLNVVGVALRFVNREEISGNFSSMLPAGSVFGTQNGLWAVDSGGGAILGLPKTATKAFNPTTAGTYTAIYYEKADAQTGQNNIETGTTSQGKATLTVGADASATLLDSQSKTLAIGSLVAVADSSYIYNGTANTLSDPCNGMFTARVIAVNGDRQDFFVSFQGKAALFASFQTAVPVVLQDPTYTYFYGVGLK